MRRKPHRKREEMLMLQREYITGLKWKQNAFCTNIGDLDKKMFPFIIFILNIFYNILSTWITAFSILTEWGEFFSFFFPFFFPLCMCTDLYFALQETTIRQSMFLIQWAYSFAGQRGLLVVNCLHVLGIEKLKAIWSAIKAHNSEILLSF